MKPIDKNVSSYQYIKSVDTWLKEVIAGYTKIYRIFYPAFVITFGIAIGFSTIGGEQPWFNEMISRSPDMQVVLGIPIFWLLGVTLLAGLMSLFAKAIYTFDLYLMYGRVFKKLDELVADMEELKA